VKGRTRKKQRWVSEQRSKITVKLAAREQRNRPRRLWRASALTPVRHGSDRELEAMKAIILRAGTVLLATTGYLLAGIALAGVG
jgi:hypothetical protein